MLKISDQVYIEISQKGEFKNKNIILFILLVIYLNLNSPIKATVKCTCYYWVFTNLIIAIYFI